MASAPVPPLAKYLASNGVQPVSFSRAVHHPHLFHADKDTRDKAIKSLSAFLSDDARRELNTQEMAKLWKGIWYCERFVSSKTDHLHFPERHFY